MALFITLPVIKIAPALQSRRTVLPWVIKVQRTVATVPIAGVIITCAVTDLIALLDFTLLNLAADRHLRSRRDVLTSAAWKTPVQDVAEEAVEVGGTDAVVIRLLGYILARASVIAGVSGAVASAGILALGTSESRGAQAFGTLVTRNARPAIFALKAPTCVSVVLAGRARKTRWTFADKAMRSVTGYSAGASITTRLPFTAIKHFVTMLTCVSCATLAAVVVFELDAAVCATGVGQALVDVALTAFPNIPRGTDAVVAAHTVHTAALVKAFRLMGDGVSERCAVVNVDLAVHTLCSPRTGAFVGIDQVDACAPVLAGLRQTLIDLIRAVHSMITWHTFTGVSAQVVGASCSVLAWIGNAFVHLLLTVAARVSGLTVTIVCVSSVQTLARVTTQPDHINTLLFGGHLAGNTGNVTV